MKRYLKILLVALLAVAVGGPVLPRPPPGFARPPDCANVCGPTVGCSTRCWDGGVTTCGEYGDCNNQPPPTPRPTPTPPCQPNWVLKNAIFEGAYNKVVFPEPAPWCEHVSAYLATWHDNNGCRPDVTECEYVTDFGRPSTDCCSGAWCGWIFGECRR